LAAGAGAGADAGVAVGSAAPLLPGSTPVMAATPAADSTITATAAVATSG
jgi:hypothetical protein